MTEQIKKYPRTRHIEGSRCQPGDEDLESVSFAAIAGRHLVVEEKVDGANSAISFSPDGRLLLQSRGHYLTGGPREKHFTLFKQWAQVHREVLWQRLGSRYIMYGEWLYAKHTVFYDQLPHYFMEFDVLDTQKMEFLSTPCRMELLSDMPIAPVRVLYAGALKSLKQLAEHIGRSAFISADHLDRLRREAVNHGIEVDRVLRETDPSDTMEGLYIKVEENQCVVDRFKYIRPSFLTAVMNSEGHWLNRPILPNQLKNGVDIFAERLRHDG